MAENVPQVNGDRRVVRLMLACAGLEHVHRGYESLAREAFEELKDEPCLDIEMVKGSGAEADREHVAWVLKRDTRLARVFGRLWRRHPQAVEQLAFAFSLQPEIIRRPPEVVYFSEWFTGVGLDWLRRVNRQNYALVMSNGSMGDRDFEHFDRVHQHTAPALEWVLERGADPTRHILLPLAFKMPAELEVPTPEERGTLRDQLGLPRDRRIVITVAALNRWHKRLDYLIEEVARLPEPRPFLLLVGLPEAETAGLRAMAHELLGDDGHSFRTNVPHPEINSYLRASDAFVLASLAESLPRALVEAMAQGLPCLANDYTVAEYAMGRHGLLADFTQPGALAGLLGDLESFAGDPAGARERHGFVYENFSWDTLKPQYVDMLHGAVGRVPFPTEAPASVQPAV